MKFSILFRSNFPLITLIVMQESYAYRDPITEFIEHLYVNFDFDAAQQKLRQCKDVLLNDFFLVAVLDDFIENARLMIFETFCRIHQCISIKYDFITFVYFLFSLLILNKPLTCSCFVLKYCMFYYSSMKFLMILRNSFGWLRALHLQMLKKKRFNANSWNTWAVSKLLRLKFYEIFLEFSSR